MYKRNKQGFTLVELIVVITILAILGTIAFLSLQGYSKKARDSRRISDISNIKTSLELFILNTGHYPEPDNGEEMYYSGELLFTQGTIGDTVTTNLSRNLQKKPVDPLFDLEYIYSLTVSKKEYEVMSIHEGEFYSNNLLNTSYAANTYVPKIEGTYNEIFIKTSNYIVPMPSIITSEDLPLDLKIKTGAINSMIISGGDNFPDLNIPNTQTKTGELIINLSVYEGKLDINSTDEEKTNAINAIQGAYSGTTLTNNSIYSNILNSSDLITLADQLVLSKSTSSSENIILNNNNIDFINASDWIQEDGVNGTHIANDKVFVANVDTYTSDLCVGGTAWASSTRGGSTYPITNAFDNNLNNYWHNGISSESNTIVKYDFGEGNGKVIKKYTLHKYRFQPFGEWQFQGSNDDSNWDTLDTNGPISTPQGVATSFDYSINNNNNNYRYYRFYNISVSERKSLAEVEMFGSNTDLYTVIQPYYITTSDTNQLDLSSVSKINSVDIINNQPAGTSIKGLVSFDGRNTWNKWNGSEWEEFVYDGDSFNNLSSFWRPWYMNDIGTDIHADGTLSIHNPTDGSTAGIVSKYLISGDFDIQVDYDASDMPAVDGSTLAFDLLNYDPYQSETEDLDWSPESASIFFGFVKNPGSKLAYNDDQGNASLYTGTYPDIGKLKYVRSGSNLSLWAWNGSWNLITTKSHLGTDPLYISLRSGSWGGQSYEGVFDNLVFNSGIISGNSQSIDNIQNSNTISEIEEGLSSLTITSETKLDFAFDLSTTDEAVTPEISEISVDME